MTTVFEVRSSVCGNKTTVVVEKKDRARMTISLETSCSKLKAYSENIKELDFKEIGKGFTQNPIYVHAVSSHITPNCLVPCGVVMAAWAEFEMMSKNLLRQVEPQSIIFIK